MRLDITASGLAATATTATLAVAATAALSSASTVYVHYVCAADLLQVRGRELGVEVACQLVGHNDGLDGGLEECVLLELGDVTVCAGVALCVAFDSWV